MQGPIIFYTNDLNDWGVKFCSPELEAVADNFKTAQYLYVGPKWTETLQSAPEGTLRKVELNDDESGKRLIGYLWASLGSHGRDAVAMLLTPAEGAEGDEGRYNALLNDMLSLDLYPSMEGAPLAKRGYYNQRYGTPSWADVLQGVPRVLGDEEYKAVKALVSVDAPISLKLERASRAQKYSKRSEKRRGRRAGGLPWIRFAVILIVGLLMITYQLALEEGKTLGFKEGKTLGFKEGKAHGRAEAATQAP